MAAAKLKSIKNALNTEVEIEKSQIFGVVKDRRDFTIKWDLSDMCLKTDDGTLIYVNRSTLCQWSPVFKVMLMTGDFKEKDQEVVEIREKETEDLIKFMEVLHPPPAVINGKLEVWVSVMCL